MSHCEHVLRIPVLGDYNVGKTTVVNSFRQRYRGSQRHRRHSDVVTSFVPTEIQMHRKNKHLILKIIDTGGMYINFKIFLFVSLSMPFCFLFFYFLFFTS
jgi:septin family protein